MKNMTRAVLILKYNWRFWNPVVRLCSYISPPLIPILSKIYVSASLKVSFPQVFPLKLYAFLDFIRDTCPAHLSRLDLRSLIMSCEEYNACSSGNFVSLNLKYLCMHFILEHPKPLLLSQRERSSFTSLKYNW